MLTLIFTLLYLWISSVLVISLCYMSYIEDKENYELWFYSSRSKNKWIKKYNLKKRIIWYILFWLFFPIWFIYIILY